MFLSHGDWIWSQSVTVFLLYVRSCCPCNVPSVSVHSVKPTKFLLIFWIHVETFHCTLIEKQREKPESVANVWQATIPWLISRNEDSLFQTNPEFYFFNIFQRNRAKHCVNHLPRSTPTLLKISQTLPLDQKQHHFCLQTWSLWLDTMLFNDDSVLCGCRLPWKRSLVLSDLCEALLCAAACRDCRGLLPPLRNVMCVLLVRPLGGLRVQSVGNRFGEVSVNKTPALISVSCICFQIRDQTPLTLTLSCWAAIMRLSLSSNLVINS